ncbi:MAG TPA: RNA polymerase sigma factor [Steroidobacteraceae bacterium]|jgi:RNA polymerase sigma-70 factor (ECF subfamily)|nr:RNA polymerase sigma factor [Steroidobacteraceae bacterium]
MSDPAWISAALTAARPQAMAALLRHFRDLDVAEGAYQDAARRALRHWTRSGPPRDPTAWLILVGRHAAPDGTRRREPPEERLSNVEDAKGPLLAELDSEGYRDDLLRLLFICCHPDLPAAEQIALALRVVCGLGVGQIARAFLVSEAAMEQHITRAKACISRANVPVETPGPAERSARLEAVSAMIYLLFNEGYSALGPDASRRHGLCDEAIRLARLLLRLFRGEPEIMALTALLLLQHSRSEARLDAAGHIVLLEDQDRGRWNRAMIEEGLALSERAVQLGRPGPYQIQAAIASLHAAAPTPMDTDWTQIERLYASLERLQPSPVVTLNRAVALARTQGPAPALELIETLAGPLGSYFYFHGVRGALLKDLGRAGEAREAFNRAIAVAGNPAEAAHIRTQLDRLTPVSTT